MSPGRKEGTLKSETLFRRVRRWRWQMLALGAYLAAAASAWLYFSDSRPGAPGWLLIAIAVTFALFSLACKRQDARR